jgi:hypothetical protein
MNQTTSKINNAFVQGQAKKISNTHTDGQSLWLFDNKIAEHREDGMYITNAGWKSRTTKERLNGLPDVSIFQKKGEWYLNGNMWDGGWIRVNENTPPEVDKDKIGKSFDTSKTYVRIDGWRGYEQPLYAVCGANDTGMWDDSPCPSNIAKKELENAKAVLKRNKIPTKLITTETSNVFCVHHYLIVPPVYHNQAKELVSEHIDNDVTRLIYAL